jgi:hypothetical protein
LHFKSELPFLLEGGNLEKLTELLIGHLSLDSPDDRRSFLIEQINRAIAPPQAATAENVNIRAMYIVNDIVNSHGGRFHRDDLDRIAKLLVDSPVLVGHNRADMPLARTFYAELETRDGIEWVKSYFYWPKSSDGQPDDLERKIDSGVLKECSISFVYGFPECSICGEDFRRCSHEIGRGDNGDQPHFIYRDIQQVLETSLVYKGSVRGTHITDKLSLRSETAARIMPSAAQMDVVPPDGHHLIACWRGKQYLVIKPN